jgi:Heterokaryon incompatibility protein (HET)
LIEAVSDRTLPTRLLDTGPLAGEPIIRLLESSGLDAETQYIALSHCWGGKCNMTLTKQTAAAFARRIEASSLPKTFFDAVMLSRTLESRYLWIDALCILQDSAEDGMVESSRM